ncbi:MAG: IPT/TIG domain-containing protein [Planctomycetes bacterium]|nr:IPT/TIG domain-containing protein [Planctomycetota bacterium]
MISRLLSTIAFSFVLSAFAAAQDITSVSPSSATIGSTVTISGSGFGTSKPTVFLSSAATGTKKFAFKVSTFSDTEIVGTVSAGVAGSFDVNVKTKTSTILEATALTLVAPTITSFSGSSAAPGAGMTLHGKLLGPKKGKLLVNGKSAKVTAWSDSSVVFTLATNLPNGPVDVVISNKIGSDTADDAFTITGSNVKLGKEFMSATISGDGFKSAANSLGGQTVVAGGFSQVQGSVGSNPNRALTMQFPFVGGTTPTPSTFTTANFGTFLTYTRTTLNGLVPSIKIWSSAGSQDLQIKADAFSGGQVKILFSGTLKNNQGEPDVVITQGECIVTLKLQ